MMRQLFQDLVVCRADGGGRWRQGLPYSIVLHAIALGALIVVPLLGEERLPLTERSISITDIWHVTPPAGRGGGVGRATPPSVVRRRTAIQTPAQPSLTVPAAPGDVAPPDSPLEPDTDVGFCLDTDCERAGTGGGGGSSVGEGDSPVNGATPVRVVRAHVDVQPPRKIHDVTPAYPEMARQIRVEGIVIVECMIAPNGRVAGARVVSGHPLLVEAALGAVNQWAYMPTRLNGVPVAVLMTVTVNFHLR